MAAALHGKRSFTGHHALQPASQGRSTDLFVPIVPTRAFISWTFGRGTVLWRVWPAVLLHTTFAAIVVSVSMKTQYRLALPQILLTVLGVVIGFVISYRASSGYDRYWMGRTSWSDVIRNARGMARVIWFHVPPRVSPRTPAEIAAGKADRKKEEMEVVMAEKRMALDLVEGFVIGLKHHLRGELGIYYEDLYSLVRPLHDHFRHEAKVHTRKHKDHTQDQALHDHPDPAAVQETNHGPATSSSTLLHPPPIITRGHHGNHSSVSTSPQTSAYASDAGTPMTPSPYTPISDPVIPAINAYGTFDPSRPGRPASHYTSSTRSNSVASSISSLGSDMEHQPLLPSQLMTGHNNGFSRDLIPFESVFHAIHLALNSIVGWRPFGSRQPVALGEGLLNDDLERGPIVFNAIPIPQVSGPKAIASHAKHRPAVAGGGQNLPLAILRCMSEWVSVLDDRATMNGNANAGLYTYISNFEDNLSTLERILTTPLPFVYSAHIRHTVWIYLFFLPFQLIDQFGWTTIPGVGIASFIYLGFLAAGEEIEQPFGYDENDLDLDLFCQEIVHKDIDQLKSMPCLNAFFAHRGYDESHRSVVETSLKLSKDQQDQDVFGTLGV